MNEPHKEPQLSDLRLTLGRFEKAPSTNKGFVRIGPNRQVKVYRSEPSAGIWVYRPPVLKAYRNELRPLKEIARGKNDQSLDDIRDEMYSALEQLAIRARLGNKRAASLFVLMLVKGIEMLNRMADFELKAVEELAETRHNWPVILSLNPNDLRHAKERLTNLKVGTKAIIPTRKEQRINFQNFWTDLANRALEACQLSGRFVPKLVSLADGATPERRRSKCWGTHVSADFYHLPSREVIIIANWQSECGKLSEVITEENFSRWWGAIRGCVLECWDSYPNEYQKALNQIGRKDEDESQRRNRAMDELRQAFRSLVGLRSKSGRGTV